MNSDGWDKRYSDSEYVWTVTVNQFVEEHLADLAPGTAIDLGAGECRNAVWLAAKGWTVTAVDYSQVGLDKGLKLANDNKVAINVVCADATTYQAIDPVGLVILSYLQLGKNERIQALEHAKTWLKPGGMVFVIAHDQTNVKSGYGGPPSADPCYDVEETVAALSGLTIQTAEVAERMVTKPDGVHTALDTLVVALSPS